MEYKSSEVKAGIFIITSFVIFIGFIAVIVGLHAFHEKSVYRARFNYVGGIEKGSTVRFAGLPVGTVVDVRITNDNFPGAEVVMEIEKNTPIRSSSRAYMTTIGIMGSFYIEITTGDPNEGLLPAGSLIASQEVTAYAQMSGVASGAVEELTELLRRMNDVLNEKNRADLTLMLHSVSQIAAVSEQNLQQTLEKVNTLIVETQTMVAAVTNVIQTNGSSISGSMVALDSTLTKSQVSLKRLNSILTDVDLSIAQNKQQYDQIISNVNSMTKNLDEFSRTIKEQPWNLVRKNYPPERQLP
jgi:phospholipid/cholesterol/gamma-HCH transport system substrate-binding protein